MTDIIIAEDDSDIQAEMQSMAWSKRIGECLHKHFPGYMWAVHADAKNNIATVQNLALSGEFGFYLHLDKIDNHNKKIIHAGGEILERYRVSRAGMDEAQVLDLKRDLRGSAVGDLS